MENKKLPYDERDIASIFNYSKRLVGRCLRDFAPDAEEHKGKGNLGQLVEELFFKYDLNCRQEADFAFVNAELKCLFMFYLYNPKVPVPLTVRLFLENERVFNKTGVLF